MWPIPPSPPGEGHHVRRQGSRSSLGCPSAPPFQKGLPSPCLKSELVAALGICSSAPCSGRDPAHVGTSVRWIWATAGRLRAASQLGLPPRAPCLYVPGSHLGGSGNHRDKAPRFLEPRAGLLLLGGLTGIYVHILGGGNVPSRLGLQIILLLIKKLIFVFFLIEG